MLLSQAKDIPLPWAVLGNKYKDDIKFAIHRDRHGRSSLAWGLEQGEKGSAKVLLYPPGETNFIRYEGESGILSSSFFLALLPSHPYPPTHASFCASIILDITHLTVRPVRPVVEYETTCQPKHDEIVFSQTALTNPNQQTLSRTRSAKVRLDVQVF